MENLELNKNYIYVVMQTVKPCTKNVFFNLVAPFGSSFYSNANWWYHESAKENS